MRLAPRFAPRFALGLLLWSLAPLGAKAQESVMLCTETVTANGGISCVPVSSGNPLPTSGGSGGSSVVQSTPAAVKGFGTLAGASASTALSTITTGPNSAVWPTTPGQVYIINPAASAANAYVCPEGGTCGTANGLVIVPGSSYGFYQPSTSMTVYQATGSNIQAQW